MGLWKKVKKAAKKVGKVVKKSAAVAAPALLGGALGTKVGIKIAKSAGKYEAPGALKRMSRVSNVMGRVEQVGATVVATYFGGAVAGAAAYRATALQRQLMEREVKKARGLEYRKIAWQKQAVRGVTSIVGAYLGGAALAAGGVKGLLSGKVGSGILDAVKGRGSAGEDQSLIGDLGGSEAVPGVVQADVAADLGGMSGGGFDFSEPRNWVPVAAGVGLLAVVGVLWMLD